MQAFADHRQGLFSAGGIRPPWSLERSSGPPWADSEASSSMALPGATDGAGDRLEDSPTLEPGGKKEGIAPLDYFPSFDKACFAILIV